jgi:hypothetical protein
LNSSGGSKDVEAKGSHYICERKERDGLTVDRRPGNLISEMACHARPADL